MGAGYKKLFKIDMLHNYFKSGYAGNIQLIPTADTVTLLKNGKMQLRRVNASFILFYQAEDDAGTPLINLGQDNKFVFALKSEEIQEFLSYTDLDKKTVVSINSNDNIAENKAVTVSSQSDSTSGGANAVDGSNATSWQSQDTDDQWIYVDLADQHHITKVNIKWQKRAKDFKVQISNDAVRWVTIEHVTNNNANNNNFNNFSAIGRYIRIHCIESNNGKGFGINELEVNADEQHSVVEYTGKKKLYFKNDPAAASTNSESPELITHDFLDRLVPESFVYEYTVDSLVDTIIEATDPEGNTFKLTDYEGNTAVIQPDENDNYQFRVDLSKHPEGKYTLAVKDVGETETFVTNTFYVNNQLSKQNVLGIVEIVYDSANGHIYGDTEYYALNFSRKSTYWKYFIVNKTGQIDFEDAALDIEDSSGDAGNPYAVYEFVIGGVEAENPDLNGLTTVEINSKIPIPLFERPKLHLELRDTEAANPVIIKNLPNPLLTGINDLESKIYVFV